MFNKKDYLVVLNPETNKKVLVKVIDSKKQTAKVVDKTAAFSGTKQIITYDEDTVLAWLGPNPKYGNVFGVKVEPYINKLELKPYDTIYLFRDLNTTEENLLLKDLKACADKMRQLKLDGIFPLEVEVREKSGMYVGLAKVQYNGEDIEKIMTLKPHSFSDSLRPTIYHEFGHFIWDLFLTEKYKAKWTRLYVNNVKVKTANSHIIENITADVKKNGISIVEDYSDDYSLVSDAIIDYITDYHTLTYKQLLLLSNQGYDVTEYFPTHVELVDHETTITDYADKSVEEYFAEAFSFYMTGQKLPKKVNLLMNKTYKKVKGL